MTLLHMCVRLNAHMQARAYEKWALSTLLLEQPSVSTLASNISCVTKVGLFVQQFRRRRADADPLKISIQQGFSPRQLKIEKFTTKLIEMNKVCQCSLAGWSPLLLICRTVLHVSGHSLAIGTLLPCYDDDRPVASDLTRTAIKDRC